MTDAAPTCDARDLEIIEALTECAFELGRAASEIAKQATDDVKRFLAASAEFRHCFFAVRMGIRLSQSLRAAARAPSLAVAAETVERERLDAEPPERDDAYERVEREREGDRERVSLPQFLKTLGLVATRAEARRDELPPHIRDTTLPTLRGLLERSGDGSVDCATALKPPEGPRRSTEPSSKRSRSRLLTSTGAITLPPRRPTATLRRDSG